MSAKRTIFLITGVPGAGKSTVADLLARRFPKAVHVRGDIFRRMIVTGSAEPTPEMSNEAVEQLVLRYRIAASIADAYFEAGFTVVVQDVIVGRLLEECMSFFRNRPVLVVLAPRESVVATRENARDKDGYGAWSVRELYDVFERETPKIGLWVDSSEQTPAETVAEIVERAASFG